MEKQPKTFRHIGCLLTRPDFLRVQNARKKWVARNIIIQVADNEDKGQRFGMTVSRKVSKSAVVRNKIRRRLREAVADTLPLHGKDNTDFVFIGRIQTKDCSYETLKNDIKWCLRKLGYDITAQ